MSDICLIIVVDTRLTCSGLAMCVLLVWDCFCAWYMCDVCLLRLMLCLIVLLRVWHPLFASGTWGICLLILFKMFVRSLLVMCWRLFDNFTFVCCTFDNVWYVFDTCLILFGMFVWAWYLFDAFLILCRYCLTFVCCCFGYGLILVWYLFDIVVIILLCVWYTLDIVWICVWCVFWYMIWYCVWTFWVLFDTCLILFCVSDVWLVLCWFVFDTCLILLWYVFDICLCV